MPFADKSFDLVWSMESGEHMPDKHHFIRELARVAAPGGKVIVVTWYVHLCVGGVGGNGGGWGSILPIRTALFCFIHDADVPTQVPPGAEGGRDAHAL